MSDKNAVLLDNFGESELREYHTLQNEFASNPRLSDDRFRRFHELGRKFQGIDWLRTYLYYRESPSLTTPAVDVVREKIKLARTRINALCKRDDWRMSIPVQSNDDDELFGFLCDTLEHLLDQTKARSLMAEPVNGKSSEPVGMITDAPLVTENITIDQRYRFEKRIKDLVSELGGRDEAYNKLDDVNIRLNARIEELEAEIVDWKNRANEAANDLIRVRNEWNSEVKKLEGRLRLRDVQLRNRQENNAKLYAKGARIWAELEQMRREVGEAYHKGLNDQAIHIDELEAENKRLKAAILEAIRAPTDVSRMVADLKMAVE